MAEFVRRAAWTFDQPLFRLASDGTDELEAMLAAIADDHQDVWVVESDESPAALAWIAIDTDTVRFKRLFIAPDFSAMRLFPLLFARVFQERAGARRWVIESTSGEVAASEILEPLGFRKRNGTWLREGETS